MEGGRQLSVEQSVRVGITQQVTLEPGADGEERSHWIRGKSLGEKAPLPGSCGWGSRSCRRAEEVRGGAARTVGFVPSVLGAAGSCWTV